ncbi:MAG: pyridoxamine 5'-phosphate oxidase family protein [Microbacterium sp.]
MAYEPGIPPAPVTIVHETDPVQSDIAWEDPLALAAEWLPGPDEDRMLMTVSTVEPDGAPRARTTMLSEFDGHDFYFHTDGASAKIADLDHEPRVALTLLWPGFTRQLVVQGTARRADAGEEARAYRLRSPYLQQLAWQNTPELAARPLAERRARWAAFLDEHGGADAPAFGQPAGWVGFAVRPTRLLFWVSNPDAPSRRIEYTRQDAGWARRALPG